MSAPTEHRQSGRILAWLCGIAAGQYARVEDIAKGAGIESASTARPTLSMLCGVQLVEPACHAGNSRETVWRVTEIGRAHYERMGAPVPPRRPGTRLSMEQTAHVVGYRPPARSAQTPAGARVVRGYASLEDDGRGAR